MGPCKDSVFYCTGRWGTPPGFVFKKSWFSLLGLKPTKTQKCWFFIGFIRKNGGPSWDQVGPKSKNVDISMVLIGFLKYHWSTKSKNIKKSFVFQQKRPWTCQPSCENDGFSMVLICFFNTIEIPKTKISKNHLFFNKNRPRTPREHRRRPGHPKPQGTPCDSLKSLLEPYSVPLLGKNPF